MRAHLSVRTYLMGLIAGVLLPPLVFGGLLVIRSAEREQDLMAMSARGRTHMAVQAVERELVSLRTALFLLAGGLSLQTSDLNAFHARAREAFGGMTVMLTTATGQAILDTRVPYGESLPDGFGAAQPRS